MPLQNTQLRLVWTSCQLLTVLVSTLELLLGKFRMHEELKLGVLILLGLHIKGQGQCQYSVHCVSAFTTPSHRAAILFKYTHFEKRPHNLHMIRQLCIKAIDAMLSVALLPVKEIYVHKKRERTS
jgi:hypothetical protein